MASNPLTNEQAGLRRAALAGVVAGLRSQVQLAMLARAIDDGEIAPPSGLLGRLFASPSARQALQLAAVGESIVDKTPFVPSRLKPLPFIGRLGFGAVSAVALAQTQQTPIVPAAIRGVGGAALGTIGGYVFRTVIGRATGLPSLVVALAEDAIAIGLARSAIRPESLAELAAEQEETVAASVESPTLDNTLPTSQTPATPTPEPPTSTADDLATAFPGAGEAGSEAPTIPSPS